MLPGPVRCEETRKPACKPGSVPCLRTATAIYLAARLPGQSSNLPESRNGPDRSCSLIWSCSRWGLPSQPVARLLVGSYIKGPKSPHLFTLTGGSTKYEEPRTKSASLPYLILRPWYFPRRYTFCCTFPVLADGGRYPPPCPVEPGLSSSRRLRARQRPSGRLAGRFSLYERRAAEFAAIGCRPRRPPICRQPIADNG